MENVKHGLELLLEKMSWKIIWIVSASVSLIPIIIAVMNDGSGQDFLDYYRVGGEILNGQISDIYQGRADGMIYRYFPFFAVMISPLSALPGRLAFAVFSAASLAASILMLVQLKKIGELLGIDEKVMKACCLFAGCSLFFTAALAFGQSVIMAAALVVVSFRLALEKRDSLAAVALGFSIVLKPVCFFIVLLFVLNMALRKEVKKAARFVACCLVPLVPDAIIFLMPFGLVHSFISGSLNADVRHLWPYISASSFTYYWFDVHWLWFMAVLLPPFTILVLMRLREDRANPANSALTIYGAGTLFHFIFMDVTHSSMPLLVLPFMLFFVASDKKVKVMLTTIIVQSVCMSAWAILPGTPPAFVLQLTMMIVWFLAFYHYVKNPPRLANVKGDVDG